MTDESTPSEVSGKSLLKFFALVFVFSMPFWLLGGITDLQLMPGLSVSALAVFAPMATALVVVHLDKNSGGMLALLLMGRSLVWIAWWSLYALTIRIFTVWLYNNTGKSVFAAALFHATVNMAYMLFPVYGSHLDMRLAGLVMAGTALRVIVVWGPKTLTKHTGKGTVHSAQK